ncbi:MAG: hypothetical protein O3B70_02100 [Bacteroidetes bacterium]|nr:hypothetical protein [Bacteroidota bacterium]MDA0903102.1 hypothetical protein [Bacteroidota bacterium]MDA1242349.1 hypothetical protein [Bacteroidota bacterium]
MTMRFLSTPLYAATITVVALFCSTLAWTQDLSTGSDTPKAAPFVEGHVGQSIQSTPTQLRGVIVGQPLASTWTLEVAYLSLQRDEDSGVQAFRSTSQNLGLGLRYSPWSVQQKAVRPFVSAGLAWQQATVMADAQSADGRTYHLWEDGLLYEFAQPEPMPDTELPTPLQRDNVYETRVSDANRMVVPVKLGVDLQLTPRVHASVAAWMMPGTSNPGLQAGVGMTFGKRAPSVRTLFPEEFLALGDDADGDGVKDVKDLCGGTERGAIVDQFGCAVDTDGDGVPDHRDLELNSPDMLVNTDGVSVTWEEWQAMWAPERGDPSLFAQDSAVIVAELNAAQMAQMLGRVGNTAANTEAKMLLELREKVYNPSITYRIQYGAYLADFEPSVSTYGADDVESIQGEHGLTLHVGGEYMRLSEVRQVLATVKSEDHQDAFITAYRNGKRISLEEADQFEKLRQERVAEAVDLFDAPSIRFHVQLGRYSAGVPVDILNSFLQMGHVEQRLESDGTHRYITRGFDSEVEARQHLSDAMSRGFEDAFLVAEANGKPCSIAEARAKRSTSDWKSVAED